MVAPYYGKYESAVPDDVLSQRPNGPRDNPTIRPGMLVCTIRMEDFKLYKWSNPKGINTGIYNHPGVILAVHGNNVDFLVISSASMEKRSTAVRRQHIAICPMEPLPDVGEQLKLKAGECDKPGYLKVHQVWRLPTRILIKNVDKITGDELEMRPESFEYAKKAVALFNTARDSPQPLRPFDGFPEVFEVFDHPEDKYPSPPKTPSIPYSPYNHPRHGRNHRPDSWPSSTQSGTLESQRRRNDKDNGASSRRNSRSTFHDNRPRYTEYTTPEPHGRQRGRDYRASSGGYGGYASRDNRLPSTEYTTSEPEWRQRDSDYRASSGGYGGSASRSTDYTTSDSQWRQRDNGYRASSGEYGGSASRDNRPPYTDYTTPEPHWRPRNDGYRASFRENGGSAFQNSREDRPSSPFNQTPVTGMPVNSHSDYSVSRTNSRSRPQVSTRV